MSIESGSLTYRVAASHIGSPGEGHEAVPKYTRTVSEVISSSVSRVDRTSVDNIPRLVTTEINVARVVLTPALDDEDRKRIEAIFGHLNVQINDSKDGGIAPNDATLSTASRVTVEVPFDPEIDYMEAMMPTHDALNLIGDVANAIPTPQPAAIRAF